MTAEVRDDRHQPGGSTLRVLIAVHGYEPAEWGPATCRALSMWASPTVRVLAVLDPPSPPFTSLIPPARRAYHGALAEWGRQETARVQRVVDRVLQVLPSAPEVVRVPASHGDTGRTIAEYAGRWPADLIVVAAPAPGAWSWLLPGAVHERVVRNASCPVLIMPQPGAPGRRARFLAGPRGILAGRWNVTANRGA